MNLIENHAQVFRRNFIAALCIYSTVALACIGWGVITHHTLHRDIMMLETHIQEQPFITLQKEETQTMEDVKNHLAHLFSVPLPGISFSVLSLDEEGLHVRGHARTAESLETWLGNVAKAFDVNRKASQPKAEKGLMFEVLLHEKP